MSEHRPETTPTSLARYPWPQGRDVALEIGLYEIQPPFETGLVLTGLQALRESTAIPEVVEPFHTGPPGRSGGCIFAQGHSPREGLSGLPEKIHRRRAEKKKMTRTEAGSPPAVDDSAKRLEEAGNSLDLVKHDQAIRVASTVRVDIRDPGTIGGALEVEVDGLSLPRDLKSQRRLADLPRSGQDNRRRPRQADARPATCSRVDHLHHNNANVICRVRFVRLL